MPSPAVRPSALLLFASPSAMHSEQSITCPHLSPAARSVGPSCAARSGTRALCCAPDALPLPADGALLRWRHRRRRDSASAPGRSSCCARSVRLAQRQRCRRILRQLRRSRRVRSRARFVGCCLWLWARRTHVPCGALTTWTGASPPQRAASQLAKSAPARRPHRRLPQPQLGAPRPPTARARATAAAAAGGDSCSPNRERRTANEARLRRRIAVARLSHGWPQARRLQQAASRQRPERVSDATSPLERPVRQRLEAPVLQILLVLVQKAHHATRTRARQQLEQHDAEAAGLAGERDGGGDGA